jgi:hypothetical protein
MWESRKSLAVDAWVLVYKAEAELRNAQLAHEAAGRDKSKAADVYNLSLEVHFAQKKLEAARTSITVLKKNNLM